MDVIFAEFLGKTLAERSKAEFPSSKDATVDHRLISIIVLVENKPCRRVASQACSCAGEQQSSSCAIRRVNFVLFEL